jgi:hypothetical protein
VYYYSHTGIVKLLERTTAVTLAIFAEVAGNNALRKCEKRENRKELHSC